MAAPQAAAVMAGRALDIAEPQVAIDFEQDPNFFWHQRILLLKLGDGGRWIAASPDWEIEVVDLADHRVVPLPRNADFPQRVQGAIYHAEQVGEGNLAAAHRDALALANVLGAVSAASGVTQARWYYSDTAYERFGEEVAVEITGNPATLLARDSVALVAVSEDGETTWTTAERVMAADVHSWREEKAFGPGRDFRVLPVRRDARRHRFCTLREAITDMTPLATPAPDDWPFRGPSAVLEVLQGARAAGEGLNGYHEYYCRSAGLSPEHPVAYKHRDLLAILTHLVCFDQVNAPQLTGAEAAARYILQIHQAVKRNPKAPDFKGTHLMVMSKLDSSGGILTGDFARFVADEQKAEAFTLKQQRLYAEEEEKRASAKAKPQPDTPGGGGRK